AHRNRLLAAAQRYEFIDAPHVLPRWGVAPVRADGAAIELLRQSPFAASFVQNTQEVEVFRVGTMGVCGRIQDLFGRIIIFHAEDEGQVVERRLALTWVQAWLKDHFPSGAVLAGLADESFE